MYYEIKRCPEIIPVQFGYEQCEKSHSYGPAVRTYWLLHFVVSGSGIFRINGHEYTLKKDEIFVIPPFVETYYEADKNTPWEYIWLGFECEKLPFDLKDVLYIPEAKSLFNKLKKAETLTLGKNEFLYSVIFELFSILLERQNKPIDYIENAINIMNSEYMNGLTVSELANKLNLERSYFTALFTRKLGLSPKEYLTDIRMKQAAMLLLQYDYNITVTALSVGYSDVYNFSKMFKKYYLMSPKEYIKKNKPLLP